MTSTASPVCSSITLNKKPTLMRLVTMLDAETKLDQFIRNNDRPLLQDKGGVSKADADVYVKSVYDTFASARRAAIQAAVR